MRVTVFGPNLNDQSKGQFHVHAEGCGHAKHYGRGTKYGGSGGWTVEVGSQVEATLEVYGDHLSDYGLTEDQEEAKEMMREWASDLHFAPCLKSLPFEVAA